MIASMRIPNMDIPIIHLSEAEAIRNFASILRQVDLGAEVVVERETVPVAIIRPAPRRGGRMLSESLQLAEGSTATLDAGFSADLQDLIQSHQPLDSPAWD